MGLVGDIVGAAKSIVTNPAQLLNLGSTALDYGASKDQLKLSKTQFNAQMDESIQRRVADARAAGVHPLFALGASVGASPTTVSGRGGSGALSRGLDRAGHLRANRGVNDAQEKSLLASAARDEAQAQVLLSREAREVQELQMRGRDGLGVQTTPLGTVDVRPAEQITTDPKNKGIQAGINPGMQKITMPDGTTLHVASKALKDATEDSGIFFWWKFQMDRLGTYSKAEIKRRWRAFKFQHELGAHQRTQRRRKLGHTRRN